MSDETIKAIVSVDLFHKNCLLLFEDIISTIKEKTLANNVTNLVGPEGCYWVWSANESEHQRQYVFQHDDYIRFVCMFVKIKEDKLQTHSSGYKIISKEIGVDPIYPLIIAFGIFQPRDKKRFLEKLNVRRNWIGNTILFGVPDDIIRNIDRSEPYEFGKLLELKTRDDTDSWYCEKSLFKIKKLIDIKDSQGIQTLADELLNINA